MDMNPLVYDMRLHLGLVTLRLDLDLTRVPKFVRMHFLHPRPDQPSESQFLAENIEIPFNRAPTPILEEMIIARVSHAFTIRPFGRPTSLHSLLFPIEYWIE